MTRVLLVDYSQLTSIAMAQLDRPIVVTRPRDAEHLALPRDRNSFAARLDQLLFAFTVLQLIFSTSPTRIGVVRSAEKVSLRVLRRPWPDACDHRKGSRPSLRPLSFFQTATWLGWASNRLANSASVPSPRMAASATFARNGAENFRRIFAMNSPPTVLIGPIANPPYWRA